MKFSNLIILLFVFTLIIEIQVFKITIGPPTFYYFLSYICIFFLFYLAINSDEFTNIPNSSKTLFKLYWIYSSIIVIYGLIVSSSYWDYKFIAIKYVPAVMMSVFIFAGLKLEQNLKLFQFIIKIIFPLAIFLTFFAWAFTAAASDYYPAIARMGTSIFFFILAFPFLKPNHRWLVYLFQSCVFLLI